MDPYVGEIRMFAGTFAPLDWAFCNGQTINIQQNTTLYAVIGTLYGGNGTTTFLLPNLQGMAPLGIGSGPGLSSYNIGETENSAAYTLDNNTLPAHTHVLNGTSAGGGTLTATNGYLGGTSSRAPKYGVNPTPSPADVADPSSIAPAGSASPLAVSNLQPYLTLNFIICLYGNFPPRP
ncbi:phage tail protein [Pedobacter sp. L105]|uniref:phage tail protein n=1 Tax=Pedobacter sp. L105 TaxID=1641871 RepID=UPI00131BD5E9|nr:tail fiber protein [Pedobacter sp. L105]